MEQISQLDSKYKDNNHLRFLYGKIFRRIVMHLDDKVDISDIIRYILNKVDISEDIKDGIVVNPIKTNNYVDEYKSYMDNSFLNISNYITTIFENNNTSLQKHYENLQMKNLNELNGFYLYKCEKDGSAEEYILKIFLGLIGKLPLAQNILIANKETSSEEIQAFFYRAILCDYNTLFVVEIKNSFSDIQRNNMFYHISSILSYKNKNNDESLEVKEDKNNINTYFKSCIIFVYEGDIQDNSFLIKLNVQSIRNMDRNTNFMFFCKIF